MGGTRAGAGQAGRQSLDLGPGPQPPISRVSAPWALFWFVSACLCPMQVLFCGYLAWKYIPMSGPEEQSEQQH